MDVWAAQENYDDIANVDNAQQQKFYEETQNRMQAFGAKPQVLRMKTVEAAQRIPENSLDYIYVDARCVFLSVAFHYLCSTPYNTLYYIPAFVIVIRVYYLVHYYLRIMHCQRLLSDGPYSSFPDKVYFIPIVLQT